MKIGLILAVDPQKVFTSYTDMIPFGIGSLGAMINRELPEVDVIYKARWEDLLAEDPDIIGISATTEEYHTALAWAESLKMKSNTPIIIGGVHISLVPESLKNCFDVAVMGEGEITLVELLRSFMEHDNRLDYDALEGIAGLCFNRNGKPVQTPPRPIVTDLDSLPLPVREELPYYSETGCHHIMSSRGCPYSCSFCASTSMKRFRMRSVESVVREIDQLVSEKGVRGIVFYDDLLIANKKRLKGLVDAIEERNLTVCDFYLQVRANLVDDEVCTLLRRMNVVKVGMGLETFSDKILRFYNKSAVTGAINQRALDLLHEYGIVCSPSLIFGAPNETREDVLTTVRALFRNLRDGKINGGGWGILRPYPGTDMWEIAKKDGMVSDEMDWSLLAEWSRFQTYMGKEISSDDLMALLEEWFVKFTLVRPIVNPDGNIHVTDLGQLRKLLRKSRPIVQERMIDPERSELGDELLVDPPLPFWGNGWGEPDGEGWRPVENMAEALLPNPEDGRLFAEIYVPPRRFTGDAHSSLDVYCNGSPLDQITFDRGGFFRTDFEVGVPGEDFLHLKVDAGEEKIEFPIKMRFSWSGAEEAARKRRKPCFSHSEIIEKVNSIAWYHSWEIEPGIRTQGKVDFDAPAILDSHFGIPEDLSGVRILEIGTLDGPLAFELEKRGADVTALDILDPDETGFALARTILGSRVPYIRGSVYNLDDLFHEPFDMVFFLDVYPYLKNPIGAFEQIGRVMVTGGPLCFSGVCLPARAETLDGEPVTGLDTSSLGESGAPIALTYPGTYGSQDAWFIPNAAALHSWLTAAGFGPMCDVHTGQGPHPLHSPACPLCAVTIRVGDAATEERPISAARQPVLPKE